MRFPVATQTAVFVSALGVTDARAAAEKGNSGALTKFGRGRAKPIMERTKRFVAIGSQTSGTTNHLVRVRIWCIDG